ncbi:hypothetical protein B484DRAFT_411088, partial [Ochromonadaceae sp. CCMP2298]
MVCMCIRPTPTLVWVLALQDVVLRAFELQLTAHTLIAQCRHTVKTYFQAVEFVHFVSNPAQLRGLAMVHVQE